MLFDGKGGGGVERGSELGVLNYILHSQASVVIILFPRCSICFVLFCVIKSLLQCCGNMSLL
jgi:hypothetical protein